MYDATTALRAIDINSVPISLCLVITAVTAFYYFVTALRMTFRQKVYVVPFCGSALFFWHDLTFVLRHRLWFDVYPHWWVEMWWYILCVAVVLEMVLLWTVFRYGREELWPDASRKMFGAMTLAGALGIGALWWLIKSIIDDPLFFFSFAITAVFSVPLHTAIMSRRQSRVGQSIGMQLATIVMLWSLSAAFMLIAPAFRSPPYFAFLAVFTVWPLANVYLITRFPRLS